MAIIDNWNQHQDESYEEWKQRVLVAKARKTCKMSWRAVIDLLGLDLSVDTVRHEAYGRAQAQDLQDARDQAAREAGRTNASLDEFEEQVAILKREKMRMQDQKRELNKLLREWARAEHIRDSITAAAQLAAETTPFPIVDANNMYSSMIEERQAALLLSDFHYGQWTDNSCNVFNSAVFYQRINSLITKTIEYGQQNNVSTLHVMCLGDLINGLIHVTTRISNTENVIQQTMNVAETLANMLYAFSTQFQMIKVYFARGNHDRVSANKQESITAESFFDIIPWYLKSRLDGNEYIEILDNSIDSEIISADIMGSCIYGVHGHRDKINSVVQNLSLLTKRIPDYVLMGHTHHSESLEVGGAEVIVNPSLSGTDSYAYELRKTSKPAQKLLIFSSSGLECTYKINLDGE